ncbi:DUF5687 family protein [Salinibacter ruber]|uniref:DUF5687 family protein n=1 Tax=Salinibacter ruber TaxID=146919 RepID=UPI0021697187|nr:DUF5687 family protein [Salinibacter ruber]MCS4195397.1 hypothetical protein [Salinibacter ruber]
MRALRILLRHRVTRWLRDPTWGTGTVAGQVVLLGFLLVLLAPLGLGSYVLGEVLRELYPEASALSLINGGMLYLVPVFMASRFLTQPPPSEHVAPYVSLPISGTGLLNGQAALSLLSLHTVFAVVLVGPVWAREIATAWTPVGAGAWLVAALLLTIVLASHGANLLHLLLGRRPWGTAGALAGIALFFAADATLGPDLFRGFSRVLFGRPTLGLVAAVIAVGGVHAALLRAMRARLEVDGRTGSPSRRQVGFYRWVERTLPAGRLVALTLRQVARTRRLRGVGLHGLALVIVWYGAALGGVFGDVARSLFLIGLFGLGPTFGLGFIVFGIAAGHADGLFARPHAPRRIVKATLVLLWLGILPGTLLLPAFLPWLSPAQSSLLLGFALWWSGILVPALVYVAPRLRKPVDTSASTFTISVRTLHGIAVYPLWLAPAIAVPVADAAGVW